VFNPSQVDVNSAVRTLVIALDLLGTLVFAISGALAGAKQRLDFFGIMVVSFTAGNFGGITRDVLIGAVPPAAISDWRYLAVSLMAGFLIFWHPSIDRLRKAILVLDAAGLALFAVSGTQKALAFGLNPSMAALLGMLTGIGGGMMRDLLLNEIPTVLRSEIYAVAALAGAVIVVAGNMLKLPSTPIAIGGAILCFAIRMIAVRRSWHLPTPLPMQ
jgi:uncharacterized membrane protein YeiH